jgi:selenide,water dikinase
VTDANLVVGYDTSDDAGVYRLTDELAIVVTADFITPPFDDPELFGRIGAANALSDVYAMGGRPLTCLNLVAFPAGKLGAEVLSAIVAGANRAITEAGAVLAGGHTVDDAEPKFGLAVTGIVHPQRCWRNSGAQPGDALILTKPVGSGVLLNANLKNRVSAAALEACIDSLVGLNRSAAEVAADFDVHAATDVTGFGLACHALEMARGAGVAFELRFADVPLLDEAMAMYERGVSTGSNRANREMAGDAVSFGRTLSAAEEELLFDPQTNGGLLFAVAESESRELVSRLLAAGVSGTARIGTVADAHRGGRVTIS